MIKVPNFDSMRIDPIIQNQFDLMLFEEGSFSPLNWLLQEGHLDYSDYQNWRQGETAYLEDYFKTSSTEIISTLEMAKHYATTLELEPSQQTYISATGKPLPFCRSQIQEAIFITIYEPPQDRIQLDLFLDSAAVCMEADLISAILNKRDTVPDILAKFKISRPEKHGKFKQLLAFEQNIQEHGASSKKKIKLLAQTITPLAYEILGRFAHEFLIPLWQKLSDEIEAMPFDAAAPEYHLSFTAFKGLQWQKVVASIDQEKDWIKQPRLIFRYAEACFKLNAEREGIANWLRLFILFPEEAEQLVPSTCQRILFSDWQEFSELDPELETPLFPAWMLIKKPALAKNWIISEIPDNTPLCLVNNLLDQKASEISEQIIHLRSTLREKSPALFVHYMKANNKKY